MFGCPRNRGNFKHRTMAQYTSNINLATFSTADGYHFHDATSDGRLGFSVSTVGDLNNDSIVDYLIGAPHGYPRKGVAGTDEGTTYVVFGGSASLAALDAADGTTDGIIDPTLLDGTTGYTLAGTAVNDSSGAAVTGTDDLDGGGVDDILIGALNIGNGRATLISGEDLAALDAADGSSDGQILLSNVDGTNGYVFQGVAAGDHAGISVARIGDQNSDGIGELLIGADLADPDGTNRGEAYLVFGGASELAALDAADGTTDGSINLSNINGTNGYRFQGAVNADHAGIEVNSIADINGDGFDELLIGAYLADPNGNSGAGETYIIFGGAANLAALDVAGGAALDGRILLTAVNGTTGFLIGGTAAGDRSGYSVSSAGDVNGDGFADLIIGSYFADPLGQANAGETCLVFGDATNLANLDAADGTSDGRIAPAELEGTMGYRFIGIDQPDWSGFAISSAGDVNGDGFDDIIVGATYANPAGSRSGETYVVFGGAHLQTLDADDGVTDGQIDFVNLNGTTGFRLDGAATLDQSGFAVSSAGDANGDHLTDLLIGAPSPVAGGVSDTYLFLSRLPDAAVTRIGSAASQTIVGGNFADTLSGLAGNDSLFGNGGNDVLMGGAGDDALNGDGGTDTADYSDATGGVTVNLGTAGAQAIGGGRGSDTLGSIEDVVGSGFGDTLTGDGNANRIDGGAGVDVISGLGGDDVLIGGTSGDTVDGGADNDLVAGGAGNDTLIGGSGIDTLDYSGFGGAVIVNMSNAAAQNTNAGGTDTLSGFENIFGGNFNDEFVGTTGGNLMQGGSGSDQISGLGGADVIEGGIGNDTLQGGGGDDLITGGAGRDIMAGGTNNDTFAFLAVSDSAVGGQRDRINDFTQGGDLVGLSAIDAVSGGGDNAFTFIGGSAFSSTAGELRFFQLAGPGQTVVEGDVDGNGAADFQIAFLGLHIFNAGDFVL